MYQPAWDEIETLYSLSHIDSSIISLFRKLKSSQSSHTKVEGNPIHYCSFFLPYDSSTNRIYLCHHIKADDWIPPGGHIEYSETPSDAALREIKEELRIDITKLQLEAWNLSVKSINRTDFGCMTHYDIWHLVHLKEQTFDYDPHEYHAAGWFTLPEGISKIKKNPDFVAIISLLSQA